MTLEESIMINNIVAEIQAKKGNTKINADSLSNILLMILREKRLNIINSDMIDAALNSIKELEVNSSLIEKVLFVMTYNKSKEYKGLSEYVINFEILKEALKSTFFDENFSLNEEILKVNPVLYNLIVEYRKAKDAISDNKVSLGLALSLDLILDQMFILFFLHPSDYEYKYELLLQTIKSIIDNQEAFSNGTKLNVIEVLSEKSIEKRLARNILFSKALLDQQYQEPIKSTKKA